MSGTLLYKLSIN